MKLSGRMVAGTSLLAAALTLGAQVATADPDHRGAEMHGPGMMGMGMAMHGPGMMGLFETFDLNHDGKVTRKEAERFRRKRFEKFDANGDGRLDLSEYEKLWLEAMRTRMVRRFQAHDTDGDAKVTLEEFLRPTERMFWRLDRDGDGVITRAEIGRRWMRLRKHDDDDD